MPKPRILTVALFVLLASAVPLSAQSVTDLVHPSLLANVSTIKPGEPFTVGLLLKIKPAWHVYWLNPGDAGLPTRVRWTLPPGYAASDLQFPVPEHIDQPGGIVVYGYQNEVLLTSTITPPAALTSTDSTAVPITAKVNWLCCSENCVPGKATLDLQLLVGEKSIPDNVQLFDAWRKRLPSLAPSTAAPLVLTDASPSSTIATSHKVTDAKSIIPGAVDGLILRVGSPVETSSGSTIPLSAQILKGQTVTAKSVPVLVTWTDSDGKTRVGEQTNVPIVSGR